MSLNKISHRLTITQQYLLALVLGIISGSIIFIHQNDTLFQTMVLYHELNTERLLSSSINPINLLKSVAEKRIHAFAILLLTQITLFRQPAACIYSFIYGLAGAILEGFMVQQYGPKGILLFIVTLLPHFLFYTLTWHRLCTEKLIEIPFGRIAIIRTFKTISTSILFIFAGIVCESTFNLWILRFFYNFFLKNI